MIVKIENKKKNGFIYYEAEEIDYECLKVKQVIEDVHDFEGVHWYITKEEEKKPELLACVFWLYNNERSNMRKIITTRTTYIMNNNGKTIERVL